MWIYQRADFESANDKLNNFSLEESRSVDSAWNDWYTHFMSVMTESIPSRLVKRTYNLPYLTSVLLKLVRKKHKLFKSAKHLATDNAWSKYKKIRNHTTAALKAARSRFLDSLISKLNSPQDFWKSFHKLSPERSRIPVDLSLGSDSESTSLGKANFLNRFFASCFSPATSTKSILKTSPGRPSLTNITVEEAEVHKLLSQHKTNTATGPDGISGHMLRNTASSISSDLIKIFHLSLTHQKVPMAWKVSNINPIPKSKDIDKCSNCRPISLLSLPSKILERLIHHHVSRFLSKHYLLSDIQFGFRPRSSTQEALLSVTNIWHSMLAKHTQIAAVFLYVKKAFDSVPHNRLIKSLHSIGIQGPLLNWFRDYLTSRSQQVVLDGKSSTTTPVTPGVPQGSILGPLMFNIFMNSISKIPLSADCTSCSMLMTSYFSNPSKTTQI